MEVVQRGEGEEVGDERLLPREVGHGDRDASKEQGRGGLRARWVDSFLSLCFFQTTLISYLFFCSDKPKSTTALKLSQTTLSGSA